MSRRPYLVQLAWHMGTHETLYDADGKLTPNTYEARAYEEGEARAVAADWIRNPAVEGVQLRPAPAGVLDMLALALRVCAAAHGLDNSFSLQFLRTEGAYLRRESAHRAHELVGAKLQTDAGDTFIVTGYEWDDAQEDGIFTTRDWNSAPKSEVVR